MPLETEGTVKCNSCVLAVTANTSENICEDENPGDKKSCQILKEELDKGNLSVGEFIEKIKAKCKTDTCRFELDELKEFFKEEYEEEKA